MVIVNVVLIVLLIIGTAFFVAAEFAIVKIRSSRIDQLIVQGRKQAEKVKRVTSNLDGYLSACQLGITITALGLGWLGKPTVEAILYPLFLDFQIPASITSLLSFLIAFSFITFLHVVIGELAPKTIAIQKAEQVSLLLATPLIMFYKIMYPFIWALNGSARKFIQLFGMKPASEHETAHTEEELRIILSESYERGEINQAEYRYVSRIFQFDELLAREIMVPRTDMICLDQNQSIEANLKIIKEEQYTRFPVIKGTKDHVIGMINTKEFFLRYAEDQHLNFMEMVRPVLTFQAVSPIKTLLKEMQKNRIHMAVLVDEYGGTAGLVTIEDILEEIVGEIRDEFDQEEKTEFEIVAENHIIVDGKVPLEAICTYFTVDIANEEYTTLGGWLYGQNNLVKEGQMVQFDGLQYTVLKKDRHRIRKVEIKKITDRA